MTSKYIHEAAILGKNVQVGNYTSIYQDVVIGDDTWIGPHVTIMPGSRIGKHCQIFPGAIIGSASQDLKQPTHKTHVYIGDYTIVREYVTLNRGTFQHTCVGSHVLLMAYVHVAHDCMVEDHVIVANSTQLAGHVQLAHHAVIGGMSAVHQFMRIGAYSMVASTSVVRKDVPPFVKVAREPLRYCGLNIVALERHGFSKSQRDCIEMMYRLIYKSNLPLQVALQEIDQTLPNNVEKEMVLTFIRQSHKGIIKKT